MTLGDQQTTHPGTADPIVHAPGLARNQSLQKAVALLRALSNLRAGATPGELAQAVELPLPTARRLLATMADAGLVEQIPETGRWVLGYELLRLGRAADPHIGVVGRARHHMQRLVDDTGESALLGVSRLPHAIEVICQVDPARMVGVGQWLGQPVHLHASAGARLGLAALPDDEIRAILGAGPLPPFTEHTITDPEELVRDISRVREQGFALSIDEFEVGLATIVVPIGAIGRDNPFAVGISAPTFRLGAERQQELLPALRACATAIHESLARA
jgi:DNA-binding IclR family transcriptional regulator